MTRLPLKRNNSFRAACTYRSGSDGPVQSLAGKTVTAKFVNGTDEWVIPVTVVNEAGGQFSLFVPVTTINALPDSSELELNVTVVSGQDQQSDSRGVQWV